MGAKSGETFEVRGMPGYANAAEGGRIYLS